MNKNNKEKLSALIALAALRKKANWEGFSNISDFADGIYDSDYVSPYTKGAGNIDSEIVIMLQDWVSAEFLSGDLNPDIIEYGRDRSLPTNRNLESLLRKNFNLDISEVYATNLFPFVKPEGMSAAIPLSALRRAAKDFALPQIKILQPKLVITLGLNTFNALRYALNLSQFSNLEAAISQPFELDGTKIWCHAHTGALGRANRNRGSVDRVTHDWSIMANWFHNNSV